MKRTILAATAAALLASATFGIAAPNWRAGGPERPSPEQMAENAAAMSDARIAALKAGLKLTPEQEKLWPALETALGDYSKQRIEARKEWREKREAQRAQRGPGAPGPQADAGAPPPPPPGGAAPQANAGNPPPPPGADSAAPDRDFVSRLEQRADRMVARGTALKQLAEAAAPLYQSLDDAQKHRFNVLFREAQGERMAEWRHDRHHGPQRGHGWERGERRDFGRPPHGGPAGGPGLPPGGSDAGPQRL
ncbi:Spy/CpxP family protein refolding chaperone [Ancylobacter oerskovii]|uniref:Spy/CpxP family protein refolding chaperone n=1 Tax=Ancylobacter oerskovii TaxID=459519 RepID=A0ABW4YSY2_9HYPH|nr:Spy/CpxP family protein refolding chaperone [Ancylobacter oerskovii]MBS7545176.1 hypothetical protein [Ancylobacter oerskovii]